jgi:acyl-CoA thioesterase FadM
VTGASIVLRPRHDGANVATWVGFTEVMALSEEAVRQWFRDQGFAPGSLYRDHGLRFCVIDSSVLILRPVDVDDELSAVVEQVSSRFFAVTLGVLGPGGSTTTVARGRLTVALVREGPGAPPLPEHLAQLVMDDYHGIGTAVATHDPLYEEKSLAQAATDGAFGFHHDWPVRSPQCHFTGQLQHAGYLSAVADLLEDFLAEKQAPVAAMLAERGLMPAVSRARVRLLTDALLGETVHAVYTVNQVMKNSLIDGRLDCHVTRVGVGVPTATGILLHGYAHTDGPQAGRFAELDAATLALLAQ